MPTFYTRAFSSSGKKASENIFPPFQLLLDCNAKKRPNNSCRKKQMYFCLSGSL